MSFLTKSLELQIRNNTPAKSTDQRERVRLVSQEIPSLCALVIRQLFENDPTFGVSSSSLVGPKMLLEQHGIQCDPAERYEYSP